MLKLILALLLILHISATTTCGGNCPSNTCYSCTCGSTKKIISPTCSGYSWNQNCCKCIISKLSGNNEHFMTLAFGYLNIGILGIEEKDYCTTKNNLCGYVDNKACAYKRYVEAGNDWSYWKFEAIACGCPTHL